MSQIYGYVRISTPKQKLQRQINNIKAQYPAAIIYKDKYTGTKINRPGFSRLLKAVVPGDTIVFDEVSRMSRNATDGFTLYKDLYSKGINLVFLKEPHINTAVYKERTQKHIDELAQSTGSTATDNLIKSIIKALNDFALDTLQEEIQLAFDRAQAEVDFLHKRTKEGLATARANGKQIGRPAGYKPRPYHSKKAETVKAAIKKYSKDFDGQLKDTEVMKILDVSVSRGSYYKYKKQLIDGISS